MRKALIPLLMSLAAAAPALADGAVTVALPDPGTIARVASEGFLHELVLANVVGGNCDGYLIGDGEWALLTGTADMVAAVLKLDTDAYDARFYGPAFDALEQAGTCAAEGPKIAPLIEKLIGMGGGTTPIG